MKCYNILFFVFITIVDTTVAVDYCRKDICSEENHIVCGNNGDFGTSCPSEHSIISMIAELIKLLLQKHYIARINIENGQFNGFSTENRVIEMSGVNELESLVPVYAMNTCIFVHDKCTNTETISATVELFDFRYNEYVDCAMAQMKNMYATVFIDGNSFSHFTQRIMANSSKIGCALCCIVHSWKTTLLACNYSQENKTSWSVYTTASPCSVFKSGCSTSFSGLSNKTEVTCH